MDLRAMVPMIARLPAVEAVKKAGDKLVFFFLKNNLLINVLKGKKYYLQRGGLK